MNLEIFLGLDKKFTKTISKNSKCLQCDRHEHRRHEPIVTVNVEIIRFVRRFAFGRGREGLYKQIEYLQIDRHEH